MMTWQRFVMAAAIAVGGFLASEASASACLTSAGCSGKTPTCNLLSFSCRACLSDSECGAPLSGKECAASGACVSAADAGPKSCSSDAECDLLAGLVCSNATCVPGCHLSIGGDTCLVGAQCLVPINASLGICTPSADAGPKSHPDSGSPGCSTDADCGLGTGLVCNGLACVVGCHDTAAGDTCPGGTKCNALGGVIGICIAPSSDGGATTCSKDSDCGSPGLVCDGSQCVAGCHVSAAGDTCPVGGTCSVLGGGLGVCLAPTGDAGTGVCSGDSDCSGGLVCTGLDGQCVLGCHVGLGGDSCLLGATCSVGDGGIGLCVGADGGAVSGCMLDSQCPSGLVCDGSQCVVGCHEGDAGDTCPSGASCSVVGGGVGVCVATSSDGGAVTCASDAACGAGLVCDNGECVAGCHDGDAGDTCPTGTRCDALGGSLGVCVEPDGGPVSVSGAGDDGGASDAGEESDATVADGGPPGGGHGVDAGSAVSGTVEGGGCSCSSTGNAPAEGGGLAFLLALTVFGRRRLSRPS